MNMITKYTAVVFMSAVLAVVSGTPIDEAGLGNPDRNLLTPENRDMFIFTTSPSVPSGWGNARNVADGKESLDPGSWPNSGVQISPGIGIGYIKVDLQNSYRVRAFAVTGYPGGGHKPVGSYYLEGSSDGKGWKMVGVGNPSQWHTPGTYPFRKEQIVPAIYPDKYRFYRVIAYGWSNNRMLIFNWGLFI